MEGQPEPTRTRLLRPGDEATVRSLVLDDADFEIGERPTTSNPLSLEDAATFLARDDVLHWVAECGDGVVGHLLCYVQHRRRGDARQLMLYEIGVRRSWRRRGIGTQLIEAMTEWMHDAGVREAWVLADNRGAVDFYGSCGFTDDPDQPVQMTLTWPLQGN